MSSVHRLGVGIASVALVIMGVIGLTACGPVRATGAAPATTSLEHSGESVWGRVPYCNCFGDAMTANVARELAEANLTVKLQEQSPRDGWLYFAVTFDPAAATRAQIGDAIAAGGGEMLDGPP